MNFLGNKLTRRLLSAFMSFCMLGSLFAPNLLAQRYSQYYQGDSRYQGRYNDGYYNDRYDDGDWDSRGQSSQGQEPGRTVGGSLGMAAGLVGGAAIAHAVIGAAGIAAWGPLAVFLIGSAITVGGAFAGAKLFSHFGGKFTQALGRDNMWMMIGAAIGAVAAIALIPVAGPFVGAAGLIAKGMIGGIAGGVLGKLFAPQLETIATPRNLMLGVGAVVGGLGGGIPGAIAGAVGGYALGAIMDDHFFSQPGDSVSNYLPFGNRGGVRGITDSIADGWDRLTSWGRDKKDDATDWWDDNYHRDQRYDPVYRQSYEYGRGRSFGYDAPFDYSYQYDRPYAPTGMADYRDYRDESYRGAVNSAYNGQMSRDAYEEYMRRQRGYSAYGR